MKRPTARLVVVVELLLLLVRLTKSGSSKLALGVNERVETQNRGMEISAETLTRTRRSSKDGFYECVSACEFDYYLRVKCVSACLCVCVCV